MTYRKKALVDLAKEYGFHLVRQKKHLVFQNAAGRIVVMSTSSCSSRALKNFRSQLKRAQGLPPGSKF